MITDEFKEGAQKETLEDLAALTDDDEWVGKSGLNNHLSWIQLLDSIH